MDLEKVDKNIHLLQIQAGKGQVSEGGPYLTAITVTLLTPDGDLPLEGAIFWKDLPKEEAVALNKDMIPRVMCTLVGGGLVQ